MLTMNDFPIEAIEGDSSFEWKGSISGEVKRMFVSFLKRVEYFP